MAGAAIIVGSMAFSIGYTPQPLRPRGGSGSDLGAGDQRPFPPSSQKRFRGQTWALCVSAVPVITRMSEFLRTLPRRQVASHKLLIGPATSMRRT